MLKTAFCKKDHRIIILPPKITAIQGPDNYPSDVTTILKPKFVSIPYGWFRHTHTQYQIATDPDFNDIIVDETTDTDLYSKTFSSSLFNSSSKYYVRIRFKDSNSNKTSDWIISSFHTPANNLRFDSYNISTDFIKTVGIKVDNGKLEPIAYQDIIDPNHTSTTTEIYIDYSKVELQIGDLLKTDNDEYFQVQSINHDGDMYVVTPDHTLDNSPNEVYFIGHRATAIKEFQDEWNEITNITATESTRNVIDSGSPSETNKIYINNQLIDVKPGDIFNADNNELFEVAVVDNDGNVAYASDVRTVACSWHHSVIIREDGSVWVTGRNYYGHLGLGDARDRYRFTNTGMTAKFVACGDEHTVIIKDDGSVWVTGRNDRGQLGLGDTHHRYQFTDTGMTAKFVACGNLYTVIIREDGSVWSTGANGSGQLGLGDTTDRHEFTNTGMTAKFVACGGVHTVIIKDDGSVWGTGANRSGQLGLGDTTDRHEFTNTGMTAKQVACGNGHTIILKDDNSVWGTGANGSGQLGLGDTTDRHEFTNTGMTAKFVACGGSHTVIIKDDDSVWVTGYNNEGQLGLGDMADRHRFTNTGLTARSVACGSNHTIIIREDNSVWGTGRNYFGHLGLGDTTRRTQFTNTGVTAKLPEGGSGSYYTKYWIIPNNPLSQPPTSVYPVSKFNINEIQLQPNPTYDPETGVQSYTFQDIRLNEPSNIIKLSVDISDVTTVTEISMDLLK